MKRAWQRFDDWFHTPVPRERLAALRLCIGGYALIYLLLNGDTVAVDARPSDAIALALRTRAPIFVEDSVIDNAKTVDFSTEKADADRLHKWLESLDPDDLGKYKM